MKIPNTKYMLWWKIYFWFILVMTVLGLPGYYGVIRIWGVLDWVSIIGVIGATAGLYAYTYKKTMLTPAYWQAIFYINVFFNIVNLRFFTPWRNMYIPNWVMSSAEIKGDMRAIGYMIILGIIISLPILYALFKLSYPQKIVVKKVKKSKKK